MVYIPATSVDCWEKLPISIFVQFYPGRDIDFLESIHPDNHIKKEGYRVKSYNYTGEIYQ